MLDLFDTIQQLYIHDYNSYGKLLFYVKTKKDKHFKCLTELKLLFFTRVYMICICYSTR